MHVSIMKLAIPCDWEVLLNRFYDLPSDELPAKPDPLGEGVEYSFSLFYAKCGRHQITVDWTTLPGERQGNTVFRQPGKRAATSISWSLSAGIGWRYKKNSILGCINWFFPVPLMRRPGKRWNRNLTRLSTRQCR